MMVANKSKTNLADVMSGYTAAEIAEYLASQEKLLKEVEAAAAKKKKETAEAKRKVLSEKMTQTVCLLKELVQQYLALELDIRPGSGNDLTTMVNLSATIKTELEAAGLSFNGRIGIVKGKRGPKAQYREYIADIFAGKHAVSRMEFFEIMSEKTGKTALQLKQRYGVKSNQFHDGIQYNGDFVTLAAKA